MVGLLRQPQAGGGALNAPQALAQRVRAWARPEGKYVGAVMPMMRDVATGERELAVPGLLRDLAVGAADALAGPSTGRVTPEMLEIMPAGGLLARAPAGVLGANVFHGGPHKWAPEPGYPQGRPLLSKMGTGEGAQAYGHGFYSAESPGVAKQYQEALGRVEIGGVPIEDLAAPARDIAGKNAFGSYDLHKIPPGSASDESIIAAYIGDYGDPSKAITNLAEDGHASAYELARKMQQEGTLKNVGTLYKLDLPDEDIAKYLDWDAPLSKQPKAIQPALRFITRIHKVPRKNNVGAETTGGQMYEYLQRNVFKDDASAVSAELKGEGVPGLKYYDQMSRGEGKGTRNFVTWDQNVLNRAKILERDHQKLFKEGGA